MLILRGHPGFRPYEFSKFKGFDTRHKHILHIHGRRCGNIHLRQHLRVIQRRPLLALRQLLSDLTERNQRRVFFKLPGENMLAGQFRLIFLPHPGSRPPSGTRLVATIDGLVHSRIQRRRCKRHPLGDVVQEIAAQTVLTPVAGEGGFKKVGEGSEAVGSSKLNTDGAETLRA